MVLIVNTIIIIIDWPQHKTDMKLLKRAQRKATKTLQKFLILMMRKAERVGIIQPGEAKAPGSPYCGLSIHKRNLYKR